MSRTLDDRPAAVEAAAPRERGASLPAPWRDPALLVCCAIAVLVFLPHGFHGYLSRDLALYTYAGQQFADGVVPYAAVVNRAGPLAHAIPGVGIFLARLVGIDDVIGVRIFFLLISVVAVGACYLMGRTVFRSRLAGIGAAAVLICNQGFVFYATNGPREKTAMVLFFILALTAMARRRWVTTGFFIALATLTWQPVLFSALAGAVVAVLLGERSGRIRALMRVAVGGILPTALIAVAYLAIGHPKLFWNDFLLINARYTKQVSLANDPSGVASMMRDGYGASLYVFAGGLVLLLLLGFWLVLRRRDRDDRGFVMILASGVMLLAGLLFALKALNGFPDVFFLIPLAGLGVGGVLARIRARHARAAIAATALLSAAATAIGLDYSISHRSHELDDQRRDTTAVMALLPRNATILSLEAPQPLVLTGKRNPTRYQLFGNGLIDYLDATWPGGREGYARHVLDEKPTVIALGGLDDPGWITTKMTAYVHVGHSRGWGWYVRRDVGASTLRKIKAVFGD